MSFYGGIFCGYCVIIFFLNVNCLLWIVLILNYYVFFDGLFGDILVVCLKIWFKFYKMFMKVCEVMLFILLEGNLCKLYEIIY